MRKFSALPFMGGAATRAAEEEARKKALAAKTDDDTEETDASAADEGGGGDEPEDGDDESAAAADDKDASVRQQERARCAAIITSAAAEGRMGLACYFAFKTGASAKAAIDGLEAAPKTDANSGRGGLAAAMAKTGSPKLGVDGKSVVRQDRAAIDHRAIYNRMNNIGQR